MLPGLLISFTCRYDEAKAFIGLQSGGANRGVRPDITCRGNGGYFLPLLIAYAIGLAMANTAVYVMQMGQPALLYLVPCCFGTISFFFSWLEERRDERLVKYTIHRIKSIVFFSNGKRGCNYLSWT